jgi:hypothetical protein
LVAVKECNNNNTRDGVLFMTETEETKLKVKIRGARKETDERIRPHRWSGTKKGRVL